MRCQRILTICPALLLLVTPAIASEKDNVPVWSEKLGNRVMIVRAGEVYPDQIVALATAKGIVVIDSGISPTLTNRYRKMIEEEFRRDDLAYVVNTHHHFDHTNGNQVFADTVIVAHENGPQAMRQFGQDMKGFISARRERYARRAGWLETLDPASKMAGRLRDLVYTSRMMCEDLESSFILTPPMLTFNDHLTLNLGDLTIRLLYFGNGLHTDNDVIVYVPEEKLVFTADLFDAYESTATVRSDGDLERWIATLDEVLQDEAGIEHVITIHAGLLSPERLVSARNSFVGILNEVRTKKSAASVMEQVMRQAGIDAATERFREIRSKQQDEFYFLEGDFSDLGERLLSEDKIVEAISVFELNAELFPGSVDAHEWLGIAYMNAGKRQQAIRSLERALELFPINSGAFDMIKMLESEKPQRGP